MLDALNRGRYWRTSAFATPLTSLADPNFLSLLHQVIYGLFHVRVDAETRNPVRISRGDLPLARHAFGAGAPLRPFITLDGDAIRPGDDVSDLDLARARQHVRDLCPRQSLLHAPAQDWETACWGAYIYARMCRAGLAEPDDSWNYNPEAWALAARRFKQGDTVPALVLQVGMTTALVAPASGIWVDIHVKQMRAAGFGPTHWFELQDYLKIGQRVIVHLTAFDAARHKIEVEFVRTES
jgi:hypothetical protein